MVGVGQQRMVVIDCENPESLATFWHELTGAEINAREADWWSLHAPAPGGMRVGFQRVPEAKAVKNRLHIDLNVDDLEAATVAAEALGARRTGAVFDEEDDPGERFQVMLDPEGNEFCLLEGYD